MNKTLPVTPIILQENTPLKIDFLEQSCLPDEINKEIFISDLNSFLCNVLDIKEQDSQNRGFKYVGLMEYPAEDRNYMLYFFPKYYDMNTVTGKAILDNKSLPYKHFCNILKTINKYRQDEWKQRSIQENTLETNIEEDYETVKHGKLALAITLIGDYLENGIYSNMKSYRTQCGNGAIDWQYTIDSVMPVIHDNTPYYFEYWTNNRIANTETLITRLHEAIIKDCADVLLKYGIADLLDLCVPIIPCESELNYFGNELNLLMLIEKEMSVQFITQKQHLLKLMYLYVKSDAMISVSQGITMFGTKSFHMVWEKVCGKVFGNQLDEDIPSEFIPDDFNKELKWSQVESRSIWYIGDNNSGNADDDEKEKNASKLKLDFIALKNDILYILDAKYYIPVFPDNNEENIKGCPGVGDVNKQHLYQLTYHPLIKKNNWKVVNAFLMPKAYINEIHAEKAISVFCSLFHGLEIMDKNGNIFRFVPIQTILLEPDLLFNHYINGKNGFEMLNKLKADDVYLPSSASS